MSEISTIIDKLKGTQEAEILMQMDASYKNIETQQSEWYEKTEFVCAEGCGECCRNFEPDLLDCEALYMAAWLIENQPEIAKMVAENKYPFPQNKGCFFWDENNSYHCTIYGGRPAICRLFGACGNKSKNEEIVLKPCKFYPANKLAEYRIPLVHKEYSQKQILDIFGILPPVMSNCMESITNINPENHETKIIQEILPDTIKKLLWILSMVDLVQNKE